MMNSSLGDLEATENYYEYNNISDSYDNTEGESPFDLDEILWRSITLITCCIGIVGNGYIIWLLGFQIRRNCFTTFILNLAVADFGYLASLLIHCINIFTYFQGGEIVYNIYGFFFTMMYTNSNFLLTAISIDRCVAVLFPIWHRCSRPKHLSSSLCVLLWISSFLLSGIICVMRTFLNYDLFILNYLLIAIVCLPLTTLSTVVLFIKVCWKPKQKNKGQLLLMILITLLCFLILAFPFNLFAVIMSLNNTLEHSSTLDNLAMGSELFFCINSSINPVIYFLVGRKRGAQSKESMKVILQKVFKEGEVTGGRQKS